MRLRLDEGARLDLCDATAWFASIDPKLGRDFVTAVDAAFESIQRSPESHTPLETWTKSGDIRRVVLRRFRHVIVFEIFDAEIVVWSVAHAPRQPHHWNDGRRSKDRE